MRKQILFIAALLCFSLVAAGFYLETKLFSYDIARTVTSDDSALSGFNFANKPSDAVDVLDGRTSSTTQSNAVFIIISADGDDADTFTVQYYGWAAKNGPAEDIANITYTLGTRDVTKLPDGTADADDLWADSATENSDDHTSNVSCSDNGNNQMVKTKFDLDGLRYWYPKVTSLVGAGEPNSVKIWYRYY